MVVEVDLQPVSPGFESRKMHDFFYLFFLCFFWSLLIQCKFAISTLLPLLSFSYFMTPYDAQASSAFSALIVKVEILNINETQVVPQSTDNHLARETP